MGPFDGGYAPYAGSDDTGLWVSAGVVVLLLVFRVLIWHVPTRGRAHTYDLRVTGEDGRVTSETVSMPWASAVAWAERESRQVGVAEAAVSEEMGGGLIETRIWVGGVYQRRTRARTVESETTERSGRRQSDRNP